MFLKKSVVILCTVLVFSDGAFVDTLKKCSISDSECHKAAFQFVLKEMSPTGIPEVNIPPFDPVELKEISLPLRNIADLHMEDGVIKGLRKCVVNKFLANIDEGHATIDLTCDLTLKGHYKAFSDSPLVKSLFGVDSVQGDGNAKIKIEKLNLKLDLSFAVNRRDGDTYFIEKSKPTYKYNILGKMSFAVDNIRVGGEDASARITNLLNQNWKLIIGSVGNQFMDRAMVPIRTFIKQFFDTVPTKYFIIEDLTPYVR